MEETIDIKAKTIKVDTGKGNAIKVTMSYGGQSTLEETEMYVTGFKAKLYKDTSRKGLWMVSFTLNEL